MSQSIGAHAFTHGNDIYFNKNQYQPDTQSGKKLLAHELTHTLQQSNGVVRRFINLEQSNKLPKALYGGADVSKFYALIKGNHKNLEDLIAGTGKVYNGIGKSGKQSSKVYRIKLVKEYTGWIIVKSFNFLF